MSHEPRAQAPDASSTEPTRTVSLMWTTLFEDEDGSQEGMRLRLEACQDLDCPCTLLFVDARAFDRAPGGERRPHGRTFELTYDVGTHTLHDLWEPRTAAEAGLQGGLRKSLRRKKTRALLEQAFREQRAQRVPQADPHYDFSAHEDGTLAAYASVYPTAGLLALHHDGVVYALDDQWCVRPGCGCSDGVLDFVVVPPGDGKEGEEVPAESLGAVHYPSGDAVGRTRKPPAALVAAVLGGDYEARLAARRDRLRAEAARRWPAPRATARPAAPPARPAAPPARSAPNPFSAAPPRGEVGRNDRCPCGSGKKFKQCCLRKMR